MTLIRVKGKQRSAALSYHGHGGEVRLCYSARRMSDAYRKASPCIAAPVDPTAVAAPVAGSMVNSILKGSVP